MNGKTSTNLKLYLHKKILFYESDGESETTDSPKILVPSHESRSTSHRLNNLTSLTSNIGYRFNIRQERFDHQ